MRIQWFVPALLLILAASPAFGLTVADVVEMTRAGLGDEVIINQIRATHSRFDLTVDEIVALHGVGITDPVLSYMITTAFGYDTASDGSYGDDYSASYDDDYGTLYTVIQEEPEPEIRTYVHLGLGYYHYPWSSVWWDYWWPDWDYYWYAGTYCRPYWSWRYRPWCHTTYCWNYYGCGPSYSGWGWDDCDRYCNVNRGRDRVRWKSSTPALAVTLAGSRMRTKAIKDADKGRIQSPLAQLEPQRTKTSKYRSPVLTQKGSRDAKSVRQYGALPSKSTNRLAQVHSNKTRIVNARQSSALRADLSKKRVSRSGTTISNSKRIRAGDREAPSVRSTKRRTGDSRSPASIRSNKSKTSPSSSKASRPSYRSGSSSGKSSPARASRSSSKSSGSSGSKGSSKSKKK
ncbi:MAG: hypothetical protein KAW17_02655 [Candidatus Eisenbacteria sp.]|nr:hypothetical protein [Candidatus Eisenbacteria bacterium]